MKICLVVPTLGDRPEYLNSALHSIRNQQVHCHVVCVIPDGFNRPFDESLVDQVVVQRRRGLSAAINEGWAAAGEDFEGIGWLGDDDALTPGSLESASACLRVGSAVGIYGNCRIIDRDGNQLYEIHPGRLGKYVARLGPNFLQQPGSLFSAEAVRRVGNLDESLSYAMDLDLFLKLQQIGYVQYIDRTLAEFRHHASSLTVSKKDPYSETRLVQSRYLKSRTFSFLHGYGLRPSTVIGKVVARYFMYKYAESPVGEVLTRMKQPSS